MFDMDRHVCEPLLNEEERGCLLCRDGGRGGHHTCQGKQARAQKLFPSIRKLEGVASFGRARSAATSSVMLLKGFTALYSKVRDDYLKLRYPVAPQVVEGFLHRSFNGLFRRLKQGRIVRFFFRTVAEKVTVTHN